MRREIATCRHCDRTIYAANLEDLNAYAGRLGLEPIAESQWWHAAIDGRRVRTCRAASYDPTRVGALGPLPWDPRFDRRHSPTAEPA